MSKHDFYLNLTDKKGREGLFREITNVRDFLSLKLTLLELLITQWNNSCDKTTCLFPYLHVDDYVLHRAFIVSNNKIISFGFGLTIQHDGNQIVAFRIKGTKITTKQISEAQSILKLLNGSSLYKEIDDDDLEQTLSKEGKFLFEYLLFEESGYVRYDYDGQTKNEVKNPKHHLDVNFTPKYSYKLGLGRGIDEVEYGRILNKDEYCRKLNLNLITKRLRKENSCKNNLKRRKKKHK